MKEFKYDVLQLIQEVKNRPCLWDKTLEVYKDRFERRKAWEEIFNILDEEYESMSSEEQRMTGEHILTKWTNIRDTFVKSTRPRMGKPRRKYVLHDHLDFLIKPMGLDENVEYSSMKEEEVSEDDIIVLHKKAKRDAVNDDPTYEAHTSKNDSSSNKTRSRKKDAFDRVGNIDVGGDIDFVGIEEINNSINTDHNRLMNEDEAFFASLLPTVVKYSEDERLEFRIEVLNLMKRIKDNRKWSSSDVP